MNLDFIFGKPKKRKRKVKITEDLEDIVEPILDNKKEVKVIEDDIGEDLEDGEIEKPKRKKVKNTITVPKGKALINVDNRSYLHMALGAGLVVVHLVMIVVATVGWVSRVEEKIIIFVYAFPSLYVTASYTWWKIQGKRVDELDE